jgi:hypothetical protein
VSAKRRDTSPKTRLSLVCTKAQKQAIEDRAETAQVDASTWVLALCSRSAGLGALSGMPLILGGQVADRLRELAQRQGINPDRALEQLLISEG